MLRSVQPALRNFIETFYKNCRFIFTCNYKNKILPALHSRCTVIDFAIKNGQKVKTAQALLKRLGKVLDDEQIEYDKKVLAELIQKYYPDFRRTINELQRYSVRGKIDSGILFSLSEANTKELVKVLKEKRFNDMRKWVINNLDKEPSSLFTTIYELMYKSVEEFQSVPQSILIIAGYQYKSAFVADQEINMVACLTEIMVIVSLNNVRVKRLFKGINESKQPLLDTDDIMWEKKYLHLLLTDVCLCSMIQ